MKVAYITIISFLISLSVFSQIKTGKISNDLEFYNATYKWFTAWDLLSKDIFQLTSVKSVDFVFFDDKYVYSTSTTTIKNGILVKGHNLINLSFKWKKILHNDTIMLPNKSIVPVGLMSFAGEVHGKINKSFFVMPLPSYWEKSGTKSNELGLENLVIGIFLHEFSHSQQMQNFGKRITELEKQNDFGVEFNDDIVQNIFNKDSTYLKIYSQEVQSFYQSVHNEMINKDLVQNGLKQLSQRQSKYFKGQYASLKEIDNLFLTMEGLGQYSIYLWLTYTKGGNVDKNIAIDGVRRNRRVWSQDEGFSLFLILGEMLAPKYWAKDMFGLKAESVIDLLDKNLYQYVYYDRNRTNYRL